MPETGPAQDFVVNLDLEKGPEPAMIEDLF